MGLYKQLLYRRREKWKCIVPKTDLKRKNKSNWKIFVNMQVFTVPRGIHVAVTPSLSALYVWGFLNPRDQTSSTFHPQLRDTARNSSPPRLTMSSPLSHSIVLCCRHLKERGMRGENFCPLLFHLPLIFAYQRLLTEEVI